MEINKSLNLNSIKTYKSLANAGAKVAKEKNSELKRTGGENVDKLEFDFAEMLSAAKANVTASIDAEANTARIEQLQEAYAGDNCPVDSIDVAEEMARG